MRTVDPERHARERGRILAAAAAEFADRGVDGTSTAGICRRAGISSGKLFHYFGTKNEVFHALFADDLVRNAEVRERALAAGSPREGFDLLLRDMVADADDPLAPGLMAAALFQVNQDAEFARMLSAEEEHAVAALTGLLRGMADRGAALAFPPERAARWVQHLVDAVFLFAGDEDFDADRARGELFTMVGWLVGDSAP